MNIDKKYLIIISCAFLCGILFCTAIVLAVLWGYKMGRDDKKPFTIVGNTGQNSQGDLNHENVSFQSTQSYDATSMNTPVTGQVYYSTPQPEQVNNVNAVTPVQYGYNVPSQNSNYQGNGQEQNTGQKQIDPKVKQEITDYLYSVDGILKETKTWSNPQQFAQDLINSTLKGDPSGFNNLIAAYETSKNKLNGLIVPKECQTYHNECIALIDDGIVMLGKLKVAINSQDVSQVMGIQKEATALEQQAKAVDKISAKLFQEYDIIPPK